MHTGVKRINTTDTLSNLMSRHNDTHCSNIVSADTEKILDIIGKDHWQVNSEVMISDGHIQFFGNNQMFSVLKNSAYKDMTRQFLKSINPHVNEKLRIRSVSYPLRNGRISEPPSVNEWIVSEEGITNESI
jgi:hypothetical protein